MCESNLRPVLPTRKITSWRESEVPMYNSNLISRAILFVLTRILWSIGVGFCADSFKPFIFASHRGSGLRRCTLIFTYDHISTRETGRAQIRFRKYFSCNRNRLHTVPPIFVTWSRNDFTATKRHTCRDAPTPALLRRRVNVAIKSDLGIDSQNHLTANVTQTATVLAGCFPHRSYLLSAMTCVPCLALAQVHQLTNNEKSFFFSFHR